MSEPEQPDSNETDKALEQQYWQAVVRAKTDTSAVESLLSQSPELVHSRFRGLAWGPDRWRDSKPEKPTEPPQDFLFTNSAIHVAAVNGYDNLLSVLLEADADPNDIGYEDNKGLTPPIVLAAWEGSINTVRILLEYGADPNLAASAETALYTAAEHGSRDKVDLLLEFGAQLDVFTAAIIGDAESVAAMLYAYPSLSDRRSLKRNRTPAEEARHHKQDAVLALFDE